jgi:hypothetical protein
MKIQFTNEEIVQALTEYCATYKSLKLGNVSLGVNDEDRGEYRGPDHEDFYALADFEIIP